MSETIRPWTPERDQLLKDLWEQGLSITQIGVVMETSRNAVVGRKARLGLPSRKRPASLAGAALGGVRVAQPYRPGRRPYELKNDPPPPSRCCWIEGDPLQDPANAYYCGEKVTTKDGGERSTYCAEHHARAYLTPSQAAARRRKIKRAMRKGRLTMGM